MSSSVSVIRDFLANMGVAAQVELDDQNRNLIVIETEEYRRRQAWIESWFTLVDQDERYSFFRERARGTGQTM